MCNGVGARVNPIPRVIFHVDMDAFFASVEQRDHPEYRGKPVIVGSPPNQRGVVCAASYEARKFKVRSAMPSRTAGKLCPHGIFVRPRMEAYRAESAAIMEILRRFTPVIERVSVDEAYLDVGDHFHDHGEADTALEAAVPMAREIKSRIASERSLTAGIGVAANKFLAKLGSDFQKPDGLTLIRERDKVEFLKPLSVRSIRHRASHRPGAGSERLRHDRRSPIRERRLERCRWIILPKA
jgi:DNA polymerase-4